MHSTTSHGRLPSIDPRLSYWLPSPTNNSCQSPTGVVIQAQRLILTFFSNFERFVIKKKIESKNKNGKLQAKDFFIIYLIITFLSKATPSEV